jgi:PAS domain S-box-containing protein
MNTSAMYRSRLRNIITTHHHAQQAPSDLFRQIYRHPLFPYLTALTLGVLSVLLRLAMPVDFDERPLLILFAIPIFLSTLTGHFLAGLVTTIVVVIGVTYLFIPPYQSLAVHAWHDALQLGVLAFVGMITSSMSWFLQRSRTREHNRWRQLNDTLHVLRRTEQQFQATFEQAAVGLAHVAPDGRLLRVNHKLCEITGYAGDELLEMRFQEITHPDDLQRDLEQFCRLLSGEISSYELEKRYLRRNGDAFWIHLTVALVRNEQQLPDYFISVIEDIQSRKEAELALATKEAYYRAVLETAADGFLMIDEQGVITGTNMSYQRLSGYTEAQLIGMAGHILDAHENESRCQQRLAQIQQHGHTLFETDHQRQDGSLWPVEINTSYLANEQRFIAFIRDISERRQAEKTLHAQQNKLLEEQQRARHEAQQLMQEAISARKRAEAANLALKNSEQRLLMAQEAAQIGIWELNIVTQMVFWSPQCCILYGIDPSTRMQQHNDFLKRVHPDDVHLFEQTMQQLTPDHNTFEIEFRIRHTDGSQRWLVSIGQIYYDDNHQAVRLLGINMDITERKQTLDEIQRLNTDLEQRVTQRTAQLVENEQRWIRALESSGLGVWDWNKITNKAFFSQRWKTMLGYEIDEINDDFHEWSSRVHPDDLMPCEQLISQHFRQEIPVYRAEHRLRHKDGSWRWILTHGMVFEWDINQQPVRIVGTHMDVTKRKQIESELIKARNEAERLSQVKSEFLANMSHEIRTPLNAVLGLARIGARDSAGRSARVTFERILDSGKHLLGVINDILDFSKIEAGKLHLEQQPFQLFIVLGHVNSLLSGIAHHKGLTYVMTQDEHVPNWILGDAQRLQQILLNLLSNAVKFTNDGQICLHVAYAENELLFSVTDSGIGMTSDHVQRLFRPFEQADTSTTRKYGGTGLGLAISYDLAKLMSGSLTATSQLGQGSCFTLRLPVTECLEPPKLDDEAYQYRQLRLSGLRILAAEDIEVNRLILEDALTQEGAEVVLVENGRLAVECIQSEGGDAFAVVLMDVQMPEMDGYTATRHICALAPQLPVIGLTAHALAEERNKCRDAGMVEHVAKPLDQDELVDAIRRRTHQRTRLLNSTPSETQLPIPTHQIQTHPPLATETLINWDALRQRFNGREAFIEKLLAAIKRDHHETPHRLRLAIETQDYETISFLAHSLKGVAGNLACETIRQKAITTELAARKQDNEVWSLTQTLALDTAHLLAFLTTREGATPSVDQAPDSFIRNNT